MSTDVDYMIAPGKFSQIDFLPDPSGHQLLRASHAKPANLSLPHALQWKWNIIWMEEFQTKLQKKTVQSLFPSPALQTQHRDSLRQKKVKTGNPTFVAQKMTPVPATITDPN